MSMINIGSFNCSRKDQLVNLLSQRKDKNIRVEYLGNGNEEGYDDILAYLKQYNFISSLLRITTDKGLEGFERAIMLKHWRGDGSLSTKLVHPLAYASAYQMQTGVVDIPIEMVVDFCTEISFIAKQLSALNINLYPKSKSKTVHFGDWNKPAFNDGSPEAMVDTGSKQNTSLNQPNYKTPPEKWIPIFIRNENYNQAQTIKLFGEGFMTEEYLLDLTRRKLLIGNWDDTNAMDSQTPYGLKKYIEFHIENHKEKAQVSIQRIYFRSMQQLSSFPEIGIHKPSEANAEIPDSKKINLHMYLSPYQTIPNFIDPEGEISINLSKQEHIEYTLIPGEVVIIFFSFETENSDGGHRISKNSKSNQTPTKLTDFGYSALNKNISSQEEGFSGITTEESNENKNNPDQNEADSPSPSEQKNS